MQPWAQRGASQSIAAVIADMQPRFNAIPAAEIVSFNPPAIPGISTTGGINFVLEARGGQSDQRACRGLAGADFRRQPESAVEFGVHRVLGDVPQVMVHVDTTRAALLGRNAGRDISDTCRPIWVASSSTTSIIRISSFRSWCRPMRSSGRRSATSLSYMCVARRGDGAAWIA